jgi:hypothetical protein
VRPQGMGRGLQRPQHTMTTPTVTGGLAGMPHAYHCSTPGASWARGFPQLMRRAPEAER